MNQRLIDLHRQQGRLVERIAGQRLALASQLLPLQRAAVASDRFLVALRDRVQTLKQHPLAVAVAVLGWVLFKPGRVWRWGSKGLFLWRSWRALRPWFAFFQSRH